MQKFRIVQLETSQKTRRWNILLNYLQMKGQLSLGLGLPHPNATQINPERRKTINFGENEFFTQNLNFYRSRRDRLFHFGEPDMIPQSLHHNIDEDSSCSLYQSFGKDVSKM